MRNLIVRAAMAFTLCAASFTAAVAQDELNAEDLAKIDAALPSEPAVAPAQPRKILVFTRCRGYVHASIPYGAYALAEMGKRTGAYEAVVSDDAAYFGKDQIGQFDGIMMLSTTMDLFENEPREQEYRKSFLEYVRSGKGLMGIHAATDCFYNWKDYGDMMGGYFDGHPWNSNSTVTVKIDDPAHPVVKPFMGRKFDITDEIYQFAPEPYSREKLRVLLSLDITPGSKTEMTRDGIKRTDGDFAVAWVRDYGDGRVFYCSLGHNTSVFQNPTVLKHYLAGIQFALGDLEADTLPSAQLSPEYLQQSMKTGTEVALDTIFAELADYDYVKDTGVMRALEEYADRAQNDKDLRAALIPRFNDFLASDAGLDGKWIVAKHVNRIGTKKNVPTLAALLADETTHDLARYALERIPAEEATTALVDALPAASDPAKAGIALSLGNRGAKEAVPALAELAKSGNAAVAEAACAALGSIATADAARALNAVRTSAPGAKDGLLRCADAMTAAGAGDAAAGIYTAFLAESEPVAIRRAALAGLAKAQGDEALPVLVEHMKSNDAAVRLVAAGSAATLTSDAAIGALAAAMSAVPRDAQLALIAGMGAAGNQAAIAPLVDTAKSEHPDVRLAAIDALGDAGDASVIPFLAGIAAGTQPDAGIAAQSLASLRGEAVDEALIGFINGGDPALATPVIAAVKARQTQGAVEALLAATNAAAPEARAAAYAGLGDLAPADALGTLLEHLAAIEDDAVRRSAELAAIDVAKRSGDASAAAGAVSQALAAHGENAAAQASYYRVHSALGSDEGLATVKGAAQGTDPALQDAAIRALADWSNPGAIPALTEIVPAAPNDTLKVIAFRGLLRQVGEPMPRPESETLALYEQTLALAPSADEKKTAIAALAKVRDPRVYDVVKPYLADEAFKADAEFVINALDKVKPVATASHNPQEANTTLDGDLDTRWGTGESMKTGMWFEVDLGWEREVKKVTLDATGSDRDYPRGYEVYLYTEPGNLGAPVASGAGEGAVTAIDVPATVCRFIRIVHTTPVASPWWSIHEIVIE